MKTTYKVMAATGYRGHQQGDEFEAELTPDEERRAKERGSIRAIKHKNKTKQEEDDG